MCVSQCVKESEGLGEIMLIGPIRSTKDDYGCNTQQSVGLCEGTRDLKNMFGRDAGCGGRAFRDTETAHADCSEAWTRSKPANGNYLMHIITPKCIKMPICHKFLHISTYKEK